MVVVFGVFPPPVTGMSLCTDRVARHLSDSCRVRRFNLSDGSAKITWPFRIRKFFRMIAAIARMAFSPSLRGALLYMPANYRGAMYYNLAAALVARIRGWRVALHHHVYYYLHSYDWRLPWLDRLMPPGSAHLALCCEMAQRLDELYAFRREKRLLPSTILLTDEPKAVGSHDAHREPPRGVRRLGHLSNLSVAKGSVDALHVFDRLREHGHDVELVIAGPVMEPIVQREIDALCQRYGHRVDYRGPVYGEEKRRFFEDVDVVLFPSRMEAQPIVLSEAFALGKPVISKALSCIPSLTGQPAWTVDPQADYVEFAATLVTQWIDQPDQYVKASEAATRRAAALRRDAEQKLQEFTAWARDAQSAP